MLARIPLILALIVSLLFVTQAQPMAMPVEMKQGGMCAGMQCLRGCCANTTCCAVVEQKQGPETPAPPQTQHHDVQFVAIELRAYTLLLPPPAPRCPVVIHDDTWAAHTLPPLAASCIRLI